MHFLTIYFLKEALMTGNESRILKCITIAKLPILNFHNTKYYSTIKEHYLETAKKTLTTPGS